MKGILALLFFITSLAHAGETTVMNLDASHLWWSDMIDGRMYIDQRTGQGSVQVRVTRRYYTHYGGGYYGGYGPNVWYETVMFEEAPVEGLYLQGDKALYDAEEGTVECGTLGRSRVFRVPTLYLSGHCQVQTQLSNGRLLVKFVTE